MADKRHEFGVIAITEYASDGYMFQSDWAGFFRFFLWVRPGFYSGRSGCILEYGVVPNPYTYFVRESDVENLEPFYPGAGPGAGV